MARPKGSPNTRQIQTIPPSRCHACASTRRGLYTNRNVQDYAGMDPAGQPFTAIIRRRCQCLDCGQFRIDQTYWYAPTPPAVDQELPDEAETARGPDDSEPESPPNQA